MWEGAGDTPGCCGGGPAGCGILCSPGARAPGAGPALPGALLLAEGPGERRGNLAEARGGGTAGPLCCGPAAQGRVLSFPLLSPASEKSFSFSRTRSDPLLPLLRCSTGFQQLPPVVLAFKVQLSSVLVLSAGEFSLITAPQKFWIL